MTLHASHCMSRHLIQESRLLERDGQMGRGSLGCTCAVLYKHSRLFPALAGQSDRQTAKPKPCDEGVGQPVFRALAPSRKGRYSSPTATTNRRYTCLRPVPVPVPVSPPQFPNPLQILIEAVCLASIPSGAKMPRDLESEKATLAGMTPLSKEGEVSSPPEESPLPRYRMPSSMLEERFKKMQELHPYSLLLNKDDLDDCDWLEHAAFEPHEAATREKVRSYSLRLSNSPLHIYVCVCMCIFSFGFWTFSAFSLCVTIGQVPPASRVGHYFCSLLLSSTSHYCYFDHHSQCHSSTTTFLVGHRQLPYPITMHTILLIYLEILPPEREPLLHKPTT